MSMRSFHQGLGFSYWIMGFFKAVPCMYWKTAYEIITNDE